MNQIIKFNGVDHELWLKTVAETQNIDIASYGDVAYIAYDGSEESYEDIEPFHIVTLACLIELLKIEKRYIVKMSYIKESQVSRFLFDEIKFNQYWLNNYQYIPTVDQTIMNIWKISDSEKENHSDRVHDYLKTRYFVGRDLSAVKLCILELYYNIFDHAQTNGNAFSFIKYNQETKQLSVAVCDMGRGIAGTIKEKYPLELDSQAIAKALEDGVTIQSKSHNKGRGLRNITSVLFDDNELKIVSNNGVVKVIGSNLKTITYDNDFKFRGTLIYFNVSMDRFEIEEMTSFYEL